MPDGTLPDGSLLDGTWIPTTAELGGQRLPDDSFKSAKMILARGTYLVSIGDVRDRGVIKLGVSKNPGMMDITGTEGPNEGRTIPAIYELNGDSLTICYALEGTTRPTEFITKAETKLYLVKYKRAYP